ncbi:MAG TPA: zf-TFIIB domain-containing protein [Steroidobacteraceae bacterium]|nr:zf-TFIIB domain-containing protein [Steroidobacteraceae bacterium]
MKCPKCHSDLTPTIRYKLEVERCPTCQGMWLRHQELDELEDEVFDFGEHAKGTLVFDSAPTSDPCPECNAPLRSFSYRFYDLQMELCEHEHGYWLSAGEDTRVLEVMKTEEAHLRRKLRAEDRWAAMLKKMRSRSFLSKVRDLFH